MLNKIEIPHSQPHSLVITPQVRLVTVALGGEAPMQGFGYLNSHPWYFRARGDRWEFAVAAGREWGFDQAIRALAGRGHGLVLCKRFEDTEIRLTEETARLIIRRAARAAVAFLE